MKKKITICNAESDLLFSDEVRWTDGVNRRRLFYMKHINYKETRGTLTQDWGIDLRFKYKDK